MAHVRNRRFATGDARCVHVADRLHDACAAEALGFSAMVFARRVAFVSLAGALLLALAGALAFAVANDTPLETSQETKANNAAFVAKPESLQPHVVLLHGLGRSYRSMGSLESALRERGYRVTNIDYPGVRKPFPELVTHVQEALEACCLIDDAPLHFVTHSLGGILVRAVLAERRPPQLGRVVMLSPPNQGSEWVDALGDSTLFQTATGPAAQELGTDPEGAPKRLGPVDFELGVLTGDESWNPVGSWLIPGADDGVVAVENARIDGMTDFRIVSENHTTIMMSRAVIPEVLEFLEHGRFSPRDESRRSKTAP